MNTITAILQPQTDGTLHLPAPAAPQATAEMVQRRLEAFEALRAMGGLSDAIADPAQWHREIREDRPLPGRE